MRAGFFAGLSAVARAVGVPVREGTPAVQMLLGMSMLITVPAVAFATTGCAACARGAAPVMLEPGAGLRDRADTILAGRIVKEIRISGLRTTREYIVRRELTTEVGKPLDPASLETDYERLDRLGIFSDIAIFPSIDVDGAVLVFVEVKETFPYMPVVSMSISDENGISAGGGFKSVNLFGRAIYFSGNVQFGGAFTTEVELRQPWAFGDRVGYEIEYYRIDRRNELFAFNEIANEIYLTLTAFRRGHSTAGIDLSYQDIKSDVAGRTLSFDNRDRVASVGIFTGYDSRDLWSNPSRGWWNRFTVLKCGVFDTDSDFWRMSIDLRRFEPVAPRQVIALFSMLDLTDGTVGVDVAEWQRYGLGGSNSIRGWSLGSRKGASELINTVEYRFLALPPRQFEYFGVRASLGIQLALFGDIGTTWDTADDFRGNWIGGGGAGIRLIVPYVGLIRFDFAAGERDAGVFVHISTREKPERQSERVR
jgi:outer membrane protein assembly factor BamA